MRIALLTLATEGLVAVRPLIHPLDGGLVEVVAVEGVGLPLTTVD